MNAKSSCAPSDFPADEVRKVVRFRVLYAVYIVIALGISIAAACLFLYKNPLPSIFDITFFVGPTAKSILEHRGLAVNMWLGGSADRLVTMHSARMPVASSFIALCAVIFGPTHVLATALAKVVVFLLPVLAAAGVMLYGYRMSKRSIGIAFCLLLLPFFIPGFLADVVNLPVEEGYFYGVIALAFTLISVRSAKDTKHELAYTLLVGILLDLLYLSKSSMVLATAALAFFCALRIRSARNRVLLIALVIAAPVGWMTYQHHASGRYAIGTSLDGMNFYKGNNANFLRYYPPVPGDNLDNHDPEMMPGMLFKNEWQYNDWHKAQAIKFIRQHPAVIVRGLLRKIDVIFLTLHPPVSGESGAPAALVLLGVLLFRVLFWAGIVTSLYSALRSRGDTQRTGWLLLATAATVSAPYLVGFGYTRHISVLLFPCVVALCHYVNRQMIAA